MKKTITLLAIAAVFTSASFAQDHHQRDNNYEESDGNDGNGHGREIAVNNNREGYGHDNERGSYYFTDMEKNMQVSAINHDYDRKIASVKNKFFMGRNKKERLVYSLELQRDAELHSVMARFHDKRNRFNRRANRYNGHGERDDR